MATAKQRERWVNKGKKEPDRGMLEQSTYSVGLGEKHKPVLTGAGFTLEMYTEMANRSARLYEMISSRHETRAASETATGREANQVGLAKDHIFKVRKLLPIVSRDLESPDFTPEQISLPGSLGRSTSKILNYLVASRKVVAYFEEPLRPFFGGESPLAVHDRVTNELAAADREQELKRESMPKETLDLYETKGALLELIEDMNRVGQVAFRGQAEIASQFNKDILNRARKKGAKASDGPTTETDSDTPSKPVNPA